MRNIHKQMMGYIFDTSVNLRDRSFMLFSSLILLALYAAVPFGLIMREPLSATISTLVGAIIFTIYVFYAFKKNKIAQAEIVLSVVVILIFLPAMFFTNGGANGGAPIWLLLGMIYIGLILKGKLRGVMMIINAVVMTVCWIVGYMFPELVTEYTRGQNYFDSIVGLFIVGAIVYVLVLFCINLFLKEEKDKNQRKLFEQTATALANAIDAKDEYTHGHSARVAEYSKMIAEMCGKTPSECEEIYQIALLHDVGKIGIDERIINKAGKLTEDEYELIKQHPVLGAQILKSISEYPDLIIGARFHHERYDGRGYPDKLKGNDIPEIARIISVADAYDAMTSKRSYRDPIPQQSVREEIVKGSGTQFDPKFANIMQHLIDLDTEYQMKEKGAMVELSGKSVLECKSSGKDISNGILIGPAPRFKNISLRCESLDATKIEHFPKIILFDSLDGRYHDNPEDIKALHYSEYVSLQFDGGYKCSEARRIEVIRAISPRHIKGSTQTRGPVYEIEAVRIRDHAQIKIDDGMELITMIIALPDSARFAYMGLTGENCKIYDVHISNSDEPVPSDYIPRIAEEVSYIKGCPEGDYPNVEMDGYRTDSTIGIPVRDGMKLSFHTMSLPTARLIWHTAYIVLFYSPDRKPSGDDYREYALIRLDGENWETHGVADTDLIVNLKDDFCGWDAWKEENKKGFDCVVQLGRDGDSITVTTKNYGIAVNVTTTIHDAPSEVYVSLTGDQCAITNIKVM